MKDPAPPPNVKVAQTNTGSGNHQNVWFIYIIPRREILSWIRRNLGRALGWRLGQWFTAVEVVLLPVIGVAVLRRPGTGLRDLFGVLLLLVPLVMFAPGWPRRGSEYAFRCLALPALLIAALLNDVVPLPSAAADTCGAARIEVDQELLPAVQTLFALDPGRTCANAVEFSALQRRDLRTPQTPVAGVITADPATLQGLGGGWGDLAVDVAPPQNWKVLGQVPAVVFLSDRGYPTRQSISLAELAELAERGVHLDTRDVTPPDPVAAAVRHASPRPDLGVRPVDLSDPKSCRNVVLPAGLDSACPGGHELRLEDGKGNTIGAAVLAIPLTTEGQRSSAEAAHAFLNRLDRAEARQALKLVDVSTTARAVLRRAAGQAPVEPPLDVTVVLDSSRSMGLAGRGATAPWTAAREALLRWVAGKPLNQTDRLTVVLARTGSGSVRDRTMRVSGGLELLGWPVGGQTGLADVLRDRPTPVPGGRPVLVLLTDGVNALTEKPVPASDRVGLVVVVIGAACTRQPGWARARCRSTDSNSEHIADQLTTLVEEP